MTFDYLMNRDRAVQFLADRLRDGTLVLALGAGASYGAKLPGWATLVGRLRESASLSKVPAEATADQLQSAADEVKTTFCKNDDAEFAKLVKQCLYDGVTFGRDLLKDDLLIAIGALMMGSRRGSVTRILTLNFDSVLEWYLTLHGFVPKVIIKPPTVEGSEDVRIYHAHGFLPHPDSDGLPESDFVILGMRSINLRLGKQGEPWFELMRHILQTGVCLFVGLSDKSFRDRALAPLLATVGDETKNTRPTGFWVLAEHESDQLTQEFLTNNVVPLYCGNHEEIPELLLSVCRKAAVTMLP